MKDESKSDKKDKEDKQKSSKKYAGNNVTATCKVPGRGCKTKKPTYRCNKGGRVHIEIKVDQIGYVKSASVNKSKSTTTDECLIEEALDYAKNTTKVDADISGNLAKSGYIIYNFIKQ